MCYYYYYYRFKQLCLFVCENGTVLPVSSASPPPPPPSFVWSVSRPLELCSTKAIHCYYYLLFTRISPAKVSTPCLTRSTKVYTWNLRNNIRNHNHYCSPRTPHPHAHTRIRLLRAFQHTPFYLHVLSSYHQHENNEVEIRVLLSLSRSIPKPFYVIV